MQIIACWKNEHLQFSFSFSKIDIFLKTKIYGFYQPKFNYYEQLSQNVKIPLANSIANSIDTLSLTFNSCHINTSTPKINEKSLHKVLTENDMVFLMHTSKCSVIPHYIMANDHGIQTELEIDE